MFDAWTDVQDRLDWALLARKEPPCYATAREQLAKAGIKVKRIIAVDPQAILFVNEFGRAMTAWSEVRSSGTVAFYCEAGMPREPSGTPEAA